MTATWEFHTFLTDASMCIIRAKLYTNFVAVVVFNYKCCVFPLLCLFRIQAKQKHMIYWARNFLVITDYMLIVRLPLVLERTRCLKRLT
jgi:hypothetical protein